MFAMKLDELETVRKDHSDMTFWFLIYDKYPDMDEYLSTQSELTDDVAKH